MLAREPSNPTNLSEDAAHGGQAGVDLHESLPNRRAFFRQALGHAVVAAETAYMAAPLSFLIYKSHNPDSFSLDPDIGRYRYTDSVLRFEEVTVRNMGVFHTEEHFERDQRFILAAVKEASFVLLERGPYFDQIAAAARQSGAEVVCIDYYNRYKMETALGLAPYLAAAAGGWLGLDYAASKATGDDGLKAQTRRGIARLVGYYSALTVFPSTNFLLHRAADQTAYPAGDVSFLVDGRTVKMLEHVQRIARENSEQKLLVLTGDVHAQGFDFYQRNPRLFEAKLRLYDLIYSSYQHSAE